MMRYSTLLTWGALAVAICFPALANGGEPPAPAAAPSVRLTVELTDGSRLKGEPLPEFERLPLRCDLGDLSISLAAIKRFDIQDDHETVVASFANGDRLTGFVRSKGVTVRTLLGELDVPWSVVKGCEVQVVVPASAAAPGPIKPTGARASGSYQKQTPAMAIDGSTKTSWNSAAYNGWIEVNLGALYELGQVRLSLQVWPTGPATHEVYVSDSPIAGHLTSAHLLQRFAGTRHNREVLTVDCPPNTFAQYVHVYCPASASWFNVFEIEVTPRTMPAATQT